MPLRKTLIAVALAGMSVGAAAQRAGPAGYLASGAFDVLAVLPPAPVAGDARDRSDRAIFVATRKLEGTPRWAMATNDVKLAPGDMMADFSCALGVTLTRDNAPRTLALIGRAAIDTGRGTNAAKLFYKRARPYTADPGPVCQPLIQLAGSYDYPSGHVTYGWTWATILAQLAPDRATAILARGRAYGDSRMVCGAHNRSAVEAGIFSADATLIALASDPAFVADRTAARAEIDALRHDPTAAKPDAAVCASEAALVAQRTY